MEKIKSYQQMGDLQNEELRRAGDATMAGGRWGRWTDKGLEIDLREWIDPPWSGAWCPGNANAIS